MQGLHRYLKQNFSGKKGQAGFTLIELLVVVTILGILAGIVTLSLVGLTTNAQAKSCMQEYKTVQAALDAYMAANNLDTITQSNQANGTNDMTSPVPLYVPSPDQSTPTYLRNSPTQWAYVWNSTGRITGIRAVGALGVPDKCQAVPSS